MTRRVGAYAKLLANYSQDDAVIAAGEKAELLFVRGLAFCATSDSDGYITEGQVARVVGAGMRDSAARAAALVKHGLWQRVEGGFQIRSWMKIHESAEEKGRQRRTDRDRKRRERHTDSNRSPNGHNPDTLRNPEGVTPDSLDCYVVNSRSDSLQSNPEQSSARTPQESTTAQTIIAEWIDRAPKRPPAQVVGQIARLVGQLLAEGIAADDIRRGLAAWMAKGLHPSTLPSVVNEVMNAPPRGNGNGRASSKAQGWLDVGKPQQPSIEGATA